MDLTQSENGTLFIREMLQWRKPRTKVRLFVTKAVMRLGVRVQVAVACGITSKGKAHGVALKLRELTRHYQMLI